VADSVWVVHARAWRLHLFGLAVAGQVLLVYLGGGTFRVPGRDVDELLAPFAGLGVAFALVAAADIFTSSTLELRHPHSRTRRLLFVLIAVAAGAIGSLAGFGSVDVIGQFRNLLCFLSFPLLWGDSRQGDGLLALVLACALSWILGSGGIYAEPQVWALPLADGASMPHLAVSLILFQAGLLRFVRAPRRLSHAR
jgi:hypothetical protein